MTEVYRHLDKSFKAIESLNEAAYSEHQTRSILKALVIIFRLNKGRLYELATDHTTLTKTISVVNRIEAFLCAILKRFEALHSPGVATELAHGLAWFDLVAVKCWQKLNELAEANL